MSGAIETLHAAMKNTHINMKALADDTGIALHQLVDFSKGGMLRADQLSKLVHVFFEGAAEYDAQTDTLLPTKRAEERTFGYTEPFVIPVGGPFKRGCQTAGPTITHVAISVKERGEYVTILKEVPSVASEKKSIWQRLF